MATIPEATSVAGPSTAASPLASNPVSAGNIPQAQTTVPINPRPVPETPPAIPPRPVDQTNPNPSATATATQQQQFETPPKRKTKGAGDTIRTVQYSRNPERLTAYLVPFPTPDLREGFVQQADPLAIPNRFLIYTPALPPLLPPKGGEKEGILYKVQRKWQGELRQAKTSDVDKKSWRGLRYTRARIADRRMEWVTTSNLDFLCRIPKEKRVTYSSSAATTATANGTGENAPPIGSGRLEELVFFHPVSLPGTTGEVKREFINSLSRTKSRAYRDASISVFLLPPAIAVDVLAFLWPFGGLAEIDAVWAACSIRGAKRARAVTKRVDATAPDEDSEDEDDPKQKKHDENMLKLTFKPTEQLEILRRYLAYECHKRDPVLFKHEGEGTAPTEAQVLEALGWSPSQNTTVGDKRNLEDEQWEVQRAKEDLQVTMSKGAKEWQKWCKTFQKKPQKALNK